MTVTPLLFIKSSIYTCRTDMCQMINHLHQKNLVLFIHWEITWIEFSSYWNRNTLCLFLICTIWFIACLLWISTNFTSKVELVRQLDDEKTDLYGKLEEEKAQLYRQLDFDRQQLRIQHEQEKEHQVADLQVIFVNQIWIKTLLFVTEITYISLWFVTLTVL